MKNCTFFIAFFLCLSSAYSQQPVDAFDPAFQQKVKEDLEKIKASVEKNNTGPTLSDALPPREPSDLDQLIESLEPSSSHNVSSNPATSPIAPTGMYNVVDSSRIEIIEGGGQSKNYTKEKNQLNILVWLVVGMSILVSVSILVKSKF